MSYVELHACSAFSFLRGGSNPEQLAELAAELHMPAMALLDRNGVYGSQRFSVACREHKVRPITGTELTMEDGSVVPVLVENRNGYANLCSLLTEAHLRSDVKGECAVKWDELRRLREGLVALISAHAAPGKVGVSPAGFRVSRKQSFQSSRKRDAHPTPDARLRIVHAFGRENVYVEIQRHFLRGEERRNAELIDLASAYDLPLLATNGVQ